MKTIAGGFYCDGQVPNCPYKEECYRTGGSCFATEDRNHAAKKKPERISVAQEKYIGHEQKEKAAKEIFGHEDGHPCNGLISAVVSVIVSFVVTLIITLAKM